MQLLKRLVMLDIFHPYKGQIFTALSFCILVQNSQACKPTYTARVDKSVAWQHQCLDSWSLWPPACLLCTSLHGKKKISSMLWGGHFFGTWASGGHMASVLSAWKHGTVPIADMVKHRNLQAIYSFILALVLKTRKLMAHDLQYKRLIMYDACREYLGFRCRITKLFLKQALCFRYMDQHQNVLSKLLLYDI